MIHVHRSQNTLIVSASLQRGLDTIASYLNITRHVNTLAQIQSINDVTLASTAKVKSTVEMFRVQYAIIYDACVSLSIQTGMFRHAPINKNAAARTECGLEHSFPKWHPSIQPAIPDSLRKKV